MHKYVCLCSTIPNTNRTVRTLQLNNDERNHLLVLANHAVLPQEKVDESISPAIQQILDRMGTYPAYVIDKRWNVSAWNQMTNKVCGNFKATDIERNIFWRIIHDEG